jgi:hypothetical protein
MGRRGLIENLSGVQYFVISKDSGLTSTGLCLGISGCLTEAKVRFLLGNREILLCREPIAGSDLTRVLGGSLSTCAD